MPRKQAIAVGAGRLRNGDVPHSRTNEKQPAEVGSAGRFITQAFFACAILLESA
jgi:hypothetical protein